MKHYFKKKNVFLYICLALFAYSCTYEKDFVNEKNHLKIKTEEKSFEELLQLPVFNSAYRKVVKSEVILSNEIMARTAIEDQYGFTIVPDVPVRIITREDGTIFYNMLIERNVKEELKFENLMIQIKNNETTAAIYKYTMGEKAKKNDNNEYILKEIVNTEFTDLNIEGRMFIDTNGDVCFDAIFFLCDNPSTHYAYDTCFHDETAYWVSGAVCVGAGGGGGGPSGPSGPGPSTSSGNHGGGGASGGNPEIPQILIPCKTGNCIEADVIVNDPCTELQELLKSNDTIVVNPYTQLQETQRPANLKTKIDSIASFMNPTTEHGFALKYTRANHKYTGTYIVGDPISFSVNLFLENSTYGGIHLHPSERGPYPSFGDLVWLLDCYEEAYDYNNGKVVSFIVVKNPSQNGPPTLTYALKIDDYLLFKQKVEQKLNCSGCTPEQKDLRIRKINDADAIEYGPDKITHEKKFLEINATFGVSLYKANEAITNWCKLKITGNIVVPEPCNN